MTHQRTCDVAIIGSGAGGGMAAYALTRAGADVCLLEAGPTWDNTADSAMFKWFYESPRRGAGTPERQFGEFLASLGGWSLAGEPYTTAPGSSFMWFRSRMLGGRTNHWGRISLRFGPDDLRRKTLDGLGDDWPISYEDIAPYYDRVDRLIGVFGSRENRPNDPDGVFQPAPRPRCHELLVKRACDRLGIPCIPSRLSILTQPLEGREACHYCGQCGRGCSINAAFSSTNVLLPPAAATGRLTLRTNAMVREITVNQAGLADGAVYIDTTTGREGNVAARVVVLAASACESARLLLNSRSSAFPQGLANSSGTVGRYLTDTVGAGVWGFIPKLVDQVPHNHDGVAGGHIYMPWWLDNRTLDFPRGYHIEVGGGLHMPGYGFLNNIQRYPVGGGYGVALKQAYRRYYGSYVYLDGRGEMVPNEHSYCELDPSVVDRWGIPVLRFHWRWGEHEVRQARHMQQTFRAIVDAMGGQVFDPMPGADRNYGISAGGQIIHELGVTRMGNDPGSSVVNRFCQAHDVKNLFVVDGGPFVSQPDKNPTWTILALAWRAADYVAELRRAGRI